MAYNVSYTSLPTFLSNSIGYNAIQNITSVTLPDFDPPASYTVLDQVILPGVYAFSSVLSTNTLPAGNAITAVLETFIGSTAPAPICSGTQKNNGTGQVSACVTLSHIFTVNDSTTVILKFSQTGTIATLDCTYSYGLVRIA